MLKFEKEQNLKLEISKLIKVTRVISIIRLFIALMFIISIICLISLEDYILYGILTVSFLMLFIIVILSTNNIFKRLEFLRRKELVYIRHYKRRKLDYSSFTDEGVDFITTDDYKLQDLDIFGPKSLFQYLNVSKTKIGRDKLSKQLKSPLKMPEGFTTSIYNMANSEDTLDIESALLEFKESVKNIDYNEFNFVINNKIKFKWFFIIPFLLYSLSIFCLILIFLNPVFLYPMISLILINIFINEKIFSIDVYKLNAFKYYNLCDSYILLSKRIISIDLNDEYFNQTKERIVKNLDNLNKIKKVYLSLSTRKNLIARIIFNLLFSYDFFMIFIYNKIIKNIVNVDELFEEIGNVEVMASFANIGIDNDTFCIPSKSKKLQSKGIYHPLVLNCVKNDFILDGGIILTGSNMSGKTTFMRTIGINQILFNAGSIVCADEFSSDEFNVFTSLRCNDMLSEGVSTFYAEILRVKRINEAIKTTKCLILIDEIFKGTNQYERIKASFEVIKKLNLYNSLFIISTHDFDLCEADNILNYHFEETYIDDKINFDYLIKTGKCKTSNAIYLLKMAKIID